MLSYNLLRRQQLISNYSRETICPPGLFGENSVFSEDVIADGKFASTAGARNVAVVSNMPVHQTKRNFQNVHCALSMVLISVKRVPLDELLDEPIV